MNYCGFSFIGVAFESVTFNLTNKTRTEARAITMIKVYNKIIILSTFWFNQNIDGLFYICSYFFYK